MTAHDPHWPTASDWLARADPDPQLMVMGLPTSVGSISPSDAWRTPAALRRILRKFATFDAESGADLRDLRVYDRGDLPLAPLEPDDAVAAIAEEVAAVPRDVTHVFVGGDNLVTSPVAAHLPHAPLDRVGVLTFDAHHDVRAFTDGRLSNGSPIRLLIEAGLPGEHVAQVGIHSFANSRYYQRWCDDRAVRVLGLPEVEERGIDAVVDDVLAGFGASVDAIHVDFDLDVLDRACAPGCPGSRPGGLLPRQLFAAARRCGRDPRVVSADFVEVDATRDVADLTLMNLATTLLAFASGVLQRTQGGQS